MKHKGETIGNKRNAHITGGSALVAGSLITNASIFTGWRSSRALGSGGRGSGLEAGGQAGGWRLGARGRTGANCLGLEWPGAREVMQGKTLIVEMDRNANTTAKALVDTVTAN